MINNARSKMTVGQGAAKRCGPRMKTEASALNRVSKGFYCLVDANGGPIWLKRGEAPWL
jgi:hypothetical protein